VKDIIKETVSELSEAGETEVLDPLEGEGGEETLTEEEPTEELEGEGTGAEASARDEEEGLSIDLSSIPEEYQDDIEEKLGEVEKYLHTQREKDSSRLRSLEQTEKEYRSLIENPKFREWVLNQDKAGVTEKVGTPAAEKSVTVTPDGSPLFSPDGVEEAFDSSEGFAGYLNAGMEKLLAEIKGTISEALVPMHQQTEDAQAQAEIAYMDKKYNDWRNHASEVLMKIEKNDSLSLEDAYKIVAYGGDSKGAKSVLKVLKTGRKKLIKNETDAANSTKAESTSEPATTLRGHILGVVKDLRSKDS